MSFENESNDTLALCMIIKNEEKTLQRCLDSVSGFIDEIVIVDTGSTDNTLSIPFKYGARVINHEWKNDFSEARNKALEHVKSDWILFMDSDEILDQKTKDNLRIAIDYDGGLANFVYVSDYVGGVRIQSTQPRLFRNKKGIKYNNPICENINKSLIKIGKEENKSVRVFPIHIQHLIGEDIPLLNYKVRRNITSIEEFLKMSTLSESEKIPYYLKLINYFNSIQERAEKILELLNKIHEIITSSDIQYKEPLFERNIVTYNLYLLYFLIKNRNFDAARAIVESIIKIYPDSITLFYMGYTLEIERKNNSKALEYIKETKRLLDEDKYNKFESVIYDVIVASVYQTLKALEPANQISTNIHRGFSFNGSINKDSDYLPEIIELD